MRAKTLDNIGVWALITWLGAFVVGIIGWAMNVVQFIGLAKGPINALLIIKGIGIFAFPVGAIMGWLGAF